MHAKPVNDVVRFLDSSHLKDELKHIPQMFEKLAMDIMKVVPSSPELTKAMQKLVEAKDQAVRSQIHAVENNLTHIVPGAK
jgi:DNA-directed RNA polymerase subunit F